MMTFLAFIRTPMGKALGIALAIGLAILLFIWWLDGEREEAVTADRAAANAEAANATAAAIGNATDLHTTREADFGNRQSADRKAMDDANRDDRSALDALFPSR